MKLLNKKFAIAATVAVLAFPLGAALTMGATTPALDGAALYATNCAGCHGPLATSSKKGATLAQIQAASGKMNISALSVAELQAIADALSPVPVPTPTPGQHHDNDSNNHHHHNDSHHNENDNDND